MVDTTTLVDDILLRELSVETKKIGAKVLVNRTNEHIGFMADIADVIILPHSEFYRLKFMVFYKLYNNNSVKALKELGNNFPYTPDYQLGIGYVLNILRDKRSGSFSNIKIRNEIDFQR